MKTLSEMTSLADALGGIPTSSPSLFLGSGAAPYEWLAAQEGARTTRAVWLDDPDRPAPYVLLGARAQIASGGMALEVSAQFCRDATPDEIGQASKSEGYTPGAPGRCVRL